MQRRRIVCILSLLIALMVTGSPALAQFGVGFGAWNWGGHNGGFGSWFGVSLWPNRGRSSSPQSQTESRKEVNGYLEGIITARSICPANQPNVACPIILDSLSEITISAAPYGASQWLTSRPDTRGHYRLSLPAGGYTVSIHHPDLGRAETSMRQIIIQPGQTNWQNFQVDLPIQ